MMNQGQFGVQYPKVLLLELLSAPKQSDEASIPAMWNHTGPTVLAEKLLKK